MIELQAMDKEIRWSAPEYHYYEKDVAWYWLVVIGAIGLGALALWQKNLLFAIFIAIAALMLISWGRRQPKTLNFTLNAKGLTIDDKKIYYFENLTGFAIIPNYAEQELNELLLKTNHHLNGWLRVIIAAQRAEPIKNLLLQYLPEVEYQESLAEHISRILKF